MNPKARTEGILVEEMGPELVIYDRQSTTSHTLNESAARLFRRCDGETTVEELEELFSEVADRDGRRQLVTSSLRQLSRANLLATPLSPGLGVSRRDALMRIAAVAAIPIVLSVVAPTKAQAASGRQVDGDPTPIDIDNFDDFNPADPK